MFYDEKLKVADTYLMKICGMGWDELADVNSLHDAETVEDIQSLCDDRLSESGFPG